MKEERRNLWGEYFQHLASHMELRDWRINILSKPSNKGTGAECNSPRGRKIGEINLSADWDTFAPDKQRHMATHELLHLHFEPADHMIYKRLDSFMGENDKVIFRNDWMFQVEYAIDALAYAIALTLPLPADVVPDLASQPKSKKGKKKEQTDGIETSLAPLPM